MDSSLSPDLRALAVLPSLGAPGQHEQKYLLDADAARLVWTVASAHLGPLGDPARPLGFVRTTYFDTDDRAYFRSAHGPVAQRIRVREYATATAVGEPLRLGERCFLELKRSSLGRRSKTRLELAPEDVAAHLERHAGPPLEPVLTTWYQRRSLGDAAGTLRVTLDEGICFCAPGAAGSPCPSAAPRALARWPGLVLEIKHWGDVPPWLGRALRGLPEAVGFSKFSAGMRAISAC